MSMFVYKDDEIPNNFNGTLSMKGKEFFFDVSGRMIKVFFHGTDVDSCREFSEKYLKDDFDGWICGTCPDKRRVFFGIAGGLNSPYHSEYAEFYLAVCVKEVYYSAFDEFFGQGSKTISQSKYDMDEKLIENFPNYDMITISGDLIDEIYNQSIVHQDIYGNVLLNDKIAKLRLRSEFAEIFSCNVNLDKSTKTKFRILASVIEKNDRPMVFSHFEFSFGEGKTIE